MPPSDRDVAYLWDMPDAAEAIRDFVAGKAVGDYLADRMLRGAVERNVEIIGEAANHVSQRFQDKHPAIPWKKIIAQRHVLAHEYGEIKHERIWAVATRHVPELIAMLRPLLPDEPKSSS